MQTSGEFSLSSVLQKIEPGTPSGTPFAKCPMDVKYWETWLFKIPGNKTSTQQLSNGHAPHSVKQERSTAWSGHGDCPPALPHPHPQPGLCFEGQRRLADDARLVSFCGVLIRWAPIEGSVVRLQKPTLHHLTRPPKHLSPVLLQLQHQFINEQEQLKQLRHETDGFWSKLIIATSPLWYWKGLHNNSSLFLTSISLQKATLASLFRRQIQRG